MRPPSSPQLHAGLRALACGATLAAVGLSAAACEPLAEDFDFDRQEVSVFTRSAIVPASPRPQKLKVLAWNVKYGAARIPFWFDYWGDRVQMSHEEVAFNMENIYRLLREYDPDIVMTEEIEVNSRRSAYYDMVQGILEHTSLNHAAYFQTWDSRYIPSEGLGRIDLGNAIFSRYPISFAERIRQIDRTDQSGVTRTFYIHRMIGRAEIDAGERPIAAYVVHTEAYDNDGTKGKQIQQIFDVMQEEPRPLVIGGDWNELPPTAARLSDFPDESDKAKGTEFEQPPYTPEIMQKYYDAFVPYISLDRYGTTEQEQRPFYTHSVLGPLDVNDKGEHGFWNRTLDYLFVKRQDSWEPGSTDVLQVSGRMGIKSNPVDLSDHAPVVGTWVFGQ
jgi:endonuclease/exonuclease/phosphatase family metal-dependent hydrolase